VPHIKGKRATVQGKNGRVAKTQGKVRTTEVSPSEGGGKVEKGLNRSLNSLRKALARGDAAFSKR